MYFIREISGILVLGTSASVNYRERNLLSVYF